MTSTEQIEAHEYLTGHKDVGFDDESIGWHCHECGFGGTCPFPRSRDCDIETGVQRYMTDYRQQEHDTYLAGGPPPADLWQLPAAGAPETS